MVFELLTLRQVGGLSCVICHTEAACMRSRMVLARMELDEKGGDA